MRLIRIGLASPNPTVGAVQSNVDQMLSMAREMSVAGVTVGCFSEQCVGGYPAEDLVQWRAFTEAQRAELERFAGETAALPTVFVAGVTVVVGGRPFNCAAVVHGGQLLGLVPKEKLPAYDVFYEGRTFSRGAPHLALEAAGAPLGDYVFGFDFGTLAVEVCEDVWSPDGPMRRRCYSGAEVIVNISCSPYRVGIATTRREMIATRSADNQALLVYTNTCGAQDGLVFDGGGYLFQNGHLVMEKTRFQGGWTSCVVDLDRTSRKRRENSTWRADCEAYLRGHTAVPMICAGRPTADTSELPYPARAGESFFLPSPVTPARSPREEMLDELISALTLGLHDYYQKTGAFRGFGVALSGGRDSALTLLLAWRAALRLVGDDAQSTRGDDAQGRAAEDLRRRAGALITAFYLPSRYSGAATREAARTLCRELGVELREVSIDEAFEREVAAATEMLGGGDPDEITCQNIQARLRAVRMWSWANTAHALFLQSGDMSEKAVGYTTIGGDLEGGLSVIADLPKTVVIALLERFHQRFGFEGLAQTLATTPGPELAEDQTAEADLMPFPVLDACLHLAVAEKLSTPEVSEALRAIFPDEDPARLAAWAQRFAEMLTRSIFKWVQAPLSLHVGSLDLDRERALQLPVVQRSEWNED